MEIEDCIDTHISDDPQFLDVRALCLQKLPDRLLLVELLPAQRLQAQAQTQA